MKKYIIALIILISIGILTIFILDNNNKKQMEENKEFEKKLDHETTIYVDNNSSDIEQTEKTAYNKIKKFEKNLNKIKK